MIIIYFMLLAILGLGGVMYYLTNKVYTDLLSVVETNWPSYFSGSGPDLLTALVYWSIFFMVVVTAIIYARVQSEKPEVY